MRYRIHGYVVESELPLPASEVDDSPDVVVTEHPSRTIPDETPPGTVLAEVRLPGASYAIVSEDEGFRLRFFGLSDFVLSRAFDRIEVVPDPRMSGDLASLLLGGNVLSVLTLLHGGYILHASAVEKDGRAMAIVGMPGAGKSTLAAMLHRSGFALLTDDVLRVEVDGSGFVCHPGTQEVRLRAGAEEMADSLSGTVRRSADERTVVALSAPAEKARLALIVVPMLVRETIEASTTVLPSPEAVTILMQTPRILGWRDEGVVANIFRSTAAMARSVPVIRVLLPWDSPPPAAAAEVLARLFAEGLSS